MKYPNTIKSKIVQFSLAVTLCMNALGAHAQGLRVKEKELVDYVNPLMGTDSKVSLSNGQMSILI